MPNRPKQIETLKKIFDQAKHCSRSESGRLSDSNLHGELQSALYRVGEECFEELKDEVYPYLSDIFCEYREEAVESLCGSNGLQLPELIDTAYNMWLNDSDEDVRVAALDAWSGYYIKSKDQNVLKILYNIANNNKYQVRVRVYAIHGLMDVAGAFTQPSERLGLLRLTDLDDNQQLNKSIDWDKVNRIIEQYVSYCKK